VRYGALVGFMFALLGLGSGVRFFASATCRSALFVGAMIVRFCYAAGWPAEIKLVRQALPEKQQALAISMLGFGSRSGAIMGRCIFGLLLRFFSWRQVAKLVAAALLFFGSIMLFIVDRMLAKAAKSKLEQEQMSVGVGGPGLESEKQSRGRCGRLAEMSKEPAVWILTAGFCCLCHILHGDDFMPLLFQALTGSPLSTSLSVVFPLGGICAMLLNATQGHWLRREQREWLCVKGCFVCVAMAGGLSLLSAVGSGPLATTPLVAVLLFTMGFSIAPSYYLLPNLFAIEFAGDDCATLISIFELISFCSKMPAHMLLLWMAGEYGWTASLLQLLGTALLAGLLMSLLLLRWHAMRCAPGVPPMSRSSSLASSLEACATRQEGSCLLSPMLYPPDESPRRCMKEIALEGCDDTNLFPEEGQGSSALGADYMQEYAALRHRGPS